MKLDRVRELFPHLKEKSIYLNHASVGPISTYVQEKIEEHLNQRSTEPIDNHSEFQKKSESAKTLLAKLFNAEISSLAWIDNVSNAMSLLAQGLEWKSGDQIILNDLEFPSNVYPFLNLEKKGVEVLFAKSKNGIVTVDDIEKLITPKTKLISVSLVQFLTGYKIDLERLGKVCKEKGIILSVDAIQGAGAVDIDVQKSNVDFLAGGSHKWLMALQGLSYFFISEELLERITPKYVGWTSVKNAWDLLDYNLDLREDATRFQNGTLSAIGVTGLEASLSTLDNFGFQNVSGKIKGNTAYFRSKLDELEIKYAAKECSEENYSGIVSVLMEQPDRKFIKLKQNNIKAAFREGHIRFSPHFYNTREEIDRVVEFLGKIAGK